MVDSPELQERAEAIHRSWCPWASMGGACMPLDSDYLQASDELNG